MKVNILVPTRSGGKFAADSSHSSITGYRSVGPAAPEDDLITSIDESRMTVQKLVATRFLAFLFTRGLTIYLLKKLPESEQKRIKKEFAEG